MCAVIGAVLSNPSEKDFDLLRRVLIESKIRGLHATGISFLPHWSKKVVTIKDSIPADKFVSIHFHKDNLKEMLHEDDNLYFVGHCRYSTSDLEYNQPIANDKKSIVHNGVITQELPENWKDLYGYDCLTKNDSELVMHSSDPLKEFSHMSMGVCELTTDRKLRFYRNGKRPIYMSTLPNGYIVTSTKDIAVRSGIDMTVEVPMNMYTTIDSKLAVLYENVFIDEPDFQKVNYE